MKKWKRGLIKIKNLRNLKKELKTVIQLAFATRENNNKKLAVHKDNATWVKQGKERTRVVDETELIELVNHLIDNVYVTFGEEVYKQEVGIPMGTANWNWQEGAAKRLDL